MEVLANVLQTVQSGQVSITPSHHVTSANRSGLSAKLVISGHQFRAGIRCMQGLMLEGLRIGRQVYNRYKRYFRIRTDAGLDGYRPIAIKV